MNHEHERDRRDLGDRREILERIEGLLLQTGNDRERERGDQQRVAVGRSLGDETGADRAAAAGSIVDDNRLAPALGKSWAIRRATVSVVPPATNGTIRSI
jgi:hypothetical protein